MNKEIIHTLILIFTVFMSFIFAGINLPAIIVYICSFLFILFYITKHSQKLKREFPVLLESVMFTSLIILIISSTGSIHSPFFFLFYLLILSLSLLLEPIVSVSTTVTIIIFLILYLTPAFDNKSIIAASSLLLFVPFSLIMGESYILAKKENRTIRYLQAKSRNVEQDSYLFLSLVVKNHIENIHKAVNNFMGDSELDEIRKNVHNLKEEIDVFENNKRS